MTGSSANGQFALSDTLAAAERLSRSVSDPKDMTFARVARLMHEFTNACALSREELQARSQQCQEIAMKMAAPSDVPADEQLRIIAVAGEFAQAALLNKAAAAKWGA